MTEYTFIDLFAGIGGFRLAFEQAGYSCLYSCEINEPCREAYFKNFNELPHKDITKTNVTNLPDFDVLTAGFPCQPFSICGKRNGFNDTRGTLFFHICEIIETIKPTVIVLENVKHLLHHDKGRTLKVILYSLEDLGYVVNYELLNTKDFGLPQNRERVIIVATKTKKFNFKKLRKITPIPKLKDFLITNSSFEYLKPEEYTLLEETRQQKSGLIFAGYRNKGIWKTGIRPNTEHLSRVHRQPNRIYSVEGVHPTLPSQETSGRFFIYLPEQNAVRKLTIEECYRIMGFPHDFATHDSLSECYKQIGNSVSIPLITELAFQIKKQIFYSNNIDLSEGEPQVFDSLEIESNFVQLNLNLLEIEGMNQETNYEEILMQIYQESSNFNETETTLPSHHIENIQIIATNCYNRKAVYTVLTTLLIYKIVHPNQDIRKHAVEIEGGFSGRVIDTKYITPTLKKLGLPAMAESGWLTRSLEQKQAYTLDYRGAITPKKVKKAFLSLLDYIQKEPTQSKNITLLLLKKVREKAEENVVSIKKVVNPEKLSIAVIIKALEEHFYHQYGIRGASKLQVIAFYAIYQILVEEMERYNSCRLGDLGSHTASDKTSNKAGDIEVFSKDNELFEVVKIKVGKVIDLQLVQNIEDKISKFNPRRYYIYSTLDVKNSDANLIEEHIEYVAETYGCQVILNGVIPTLKYYLRLIMSLDKFMNNYSDLVEADTELMATHKMKWNEILNEFGI